MCRSTKSEQSGQPYKLYLLEKCNAQGDQWADDVRGRIQGALSGLHAEKARYHRDCMSRLFANRTLPHNELESSVTPSSSIGNKDTALEHVIGDVSADKSRIWNSIELFQQYTSYFGSTLTRENLVNQLCLHFGKKLLVLTSPGIASIIAFRGNTLKIVKNNKLEKSARQLFTTSRYTTHT